MSKCPFSELSVTEKPHWQAAHPEGGYTTKFCLIHPDIIHGHIVADDDVVMDYIDIGVFQTVIRESNLADKPIHMLFNLNHVKGISLRYKKNLVNLLYNSGPTFKLLVIYEADPEIRSIVETFAAIVPEKSAVVIADSYREAMQMILDSKSGKKTHVTCESDEEEQYKAYKKEFFSALARFNWLNLLNHPITVPNGTHPLYPYFKALEALQQDLCEKQELHLKEMETITGEYEQKIAEKAVLLNVQEDMNKKIESQLENEKSLLTFQITAKDMELKRLSSIMTEKRLKLDMIHRLVEEENIDPSLKKEITSCCQKLADCYNQYETKTDKETTVEDSAFVSRLQRKHPGLSKQDLRVSLMIKQDYSTVEIAKTIGITPRGVESVRYRLHKKLGLGKHESIRNYLLDLEATTR